jgi:hypothetical protein
MRGISLAAGFAALLSAGAAQAGDYNVYCAGTRLEIDSRNWDQMLSARGTPLCKLGEFNYLSDAETFVEKNFGGKDKECYCPR